MKKLLKTLGLGTTMELVGLTGMVASVVGVSKSRKAILNAQSEEEMDKYIKRGKTFGKMAGMSGILMGTGGIIASTEDLRKADEVFSGEDIESLRNELRNKNSVKEIAEEAVEQAEEIIEEMIEENESEESQSE